MIREDVSWSLLPPSIAALARASPKNLGDYWHSRVEDFEAGNPWSKYRADIDILSLRLLQKAVVDLTPLLHFWVRCPRVFARQPPGSPERQKRTHRGENLPRALRPRGETTNRSLHK